MALKLEYQKKLLEKKHSELEHSIAELDLAYPQPVSSTDLKNGPHDIEEDATDLTEMEKERSLMTNQQVLLTQVQQALQRLENGTYGVCQRCGGLIPTKRLQALPWAEYDVECEAQLEAAGSGEQAFYNTPQTF